MMLSVTVSTPYLALDFATKCGASMVEDESDVPCCRNIERELDVSVISCELSVEINDSK